METLTLASSDGIESKVGKRESEGREWDLVILYVHTPERERKP